MIDDYRLRCIVSGCRRTLGLRKGEHASHRAAFAGLWMWLHGPQSWAANPDVVALTITVHQQNIDTFLKREAA